MVVDLPVDPPDPGPADASAALARETETCPACTSRLLVTDEAEICPGCGYLTLLLACAVCGAEQRWRYGSQDPPARWWRLRPIAGLASVLVDSAACGVLALNQLATSGKIPVEPGGPKVPR